MPSTLNRRDRWLLGGLFIAAALSLTFYIKFGDRAFPEHAIRFDVNRTQAAEKAQDYAKRLGIDTAGYMQATRFQARGRDKTYLEREVGEKETGQLGSELGLWYFTTRFFKPEQTEEARVQVGTDGRLIGLSHRLPQEAKGAKLSREQARAAAEKFLHENTDIDLSKYAFVSASDTALPNRTEHSLVWEAKERKLAEAKPRVNVGLSGDQISSFSHSLTVPEAWTRDFDKQYSRNQLAGRVANAITYFLFSIAVVITFILHYRKVNLRTRFAVVMATVVSLAVLVQTVNSLPMYTFAYPTSMSWPSFVLESLLRPLMDIVLVGLSIYLVLAAGEALYREVWPKRQSLESYLGRGLMARRATMGLLAGSLVGVIQMAYVVAYYFLGKKVGFWVPVGIEYSDIFSTGAPWIYALVVGLYAAIKEEGTFRLFGLAFFKRYLKFTWIGIIITSVIWAFLHSTYPQMPWYARGIELTLVGILFSWLFLRYGFLASVSAHYVYNSLGGAVFSLTTRSPYIIITSLLVVVVPVIIGVTSLIRAKRRGGFIDEAEVSNEALTARLEREKAKAVPRREVTLPAFPARTLSRGVRALLVLTIPASIALSLYAAPRFSLDAPPVNVNRSEAISRAKDALRDRGVDPEKYRNVATATGYMLSPTTLRYLSENAPLERVREIYAKDLPQTAWRVRFFRFNEKEEYAVQLLSDGAVYTVGHTLEQTKSGATLSQDQAEAVAKTYAQKHLGYDLNQYAVVERKQFKLPHRLDHEIVLERKGRLVAEAKLQTRISVSGDEITSVSTAVDLPEAYRLTRERPALWNSLGMIGLSMVIIGTALLIFRLFLRLLKDKFFPTRYAITTAVGAVGLLMIGVVNGLATFFLSYTTETPPATFIAMNAFSEWMIMGGYFFTMLLVFGTAMGLWKRSKLSPPSLSAETYPERRDAVFAAYTLPLAVGALTLLAGYALYATGLVKTPTLSSTPAWINTYVPALGTFTRIPLSIYSYLLMALGVVAVASALKRKSLIILAALLYIGLNVMAQARDWQGALATTIRQLVTILPLVGIIALVRLNAWAYALMIFVATLLPSGFYLALQPDLTLRINGLVLLALGVAPLIAFLVYDRRHIFGLETKKPPAKRGMAPRLRHGH